MMETNQQQEIRIRQVLGNMLPLAIPLETCTVSIVNGQVQKTYTDFVPTKPVTVILTCGNFSAKRVAVMDENIPNVAHVEFGADLKLGVYAVTALTKSDDCKPMRFKQRSVVEIVDTTAEAGIVPGVEFETEVHWLSAAVFFVGGGGGIGEETDPTVPQHVKDITQEDISNWNSKQAALSFDQAPTSGSSNLVPSGGIKAYVDNLIASLQNVLNTITQDGETQSVIDTFNEVKAFLEGIDTSDPTLFNQLKGLSDAITALQTAVAGKVDKEQGKGLFSGSYNDLSDKPTIPSSLSQLSEDSTHRTVTDAEKTSWGNKQNALTFDDVPTANSNNPVKSGGVFNSLQIPVENVSATGDVSQALNPNTFYKFGAIDSLDLTLVAGTGLVVYFGRFSTSANWGGTGLHVTQPNGVTNGANNPSVEVLKTYEFNIMDNVLLLMEV